MRANASLFLQESPKNELPPPTITPQKQRDLLVKVFYCIVVMDRVRGVYFHLGCDNHHGKVSKFDPFLEKF